jgi:hypothetical protein
MLTTYLAPDYVLVGVVILAKFYSSSVLQHYVK